jgi:putative inorganic carbon (hco3(-)) transporter
VSWPLPASVMVGVPADKTPMQVLDQALAAVRRGSALVVSFLVCAIFAPWVALLGPVRKVLLAIVVLDIPFQLETNFQHRDAVAEFGGLGGFNVSMTTAALAALYAAGLMDCLARRSRPVLPSLSLILPLATYLLFVALSIITAYDHGLYLRALFLLVQMFLLYLYLVWSIRTRDDVRDIVMLLICGLLIESLIMIGLSRSGEGFELAGMTFRVDASADALQPARVGGTVGSPNNAAAYLSMLLAPAVGVLLTNLGRVCKMLAALGVSVGWLALILTQSRGGWIAAGLSIVIFSLAQRRRVRLPLAAPFLLGVCVTALSLTAHQTITQRLTADDQGSAYVRLPLMLTALEIIGDHPMLGIGANNYTAALERYQSTFTGDWLYTVHNQYLLIWAETGIGGLVAFLSFLIVTLRRGWAQWKRADRLLSPIALGFTAALIGHMAHMHVDLFSGRPQVQLLCVVAALVGAMGHRTISDS